MSNDQAATDTEAQIERFARLCALAPEQRTAALAQMTLDPAQRQELVELLAADAAPELDLSGELGRSAERLVRRGQVGDLLGPWRMLGEIGAGGMGTVFMAERADGAFEQRVAIKLLRGFPTADGLRRLRQERQILARLDHPNIARLLDGGETVEGQPWLVMELVEGLTLSAWLDAQSPSRAQRLALFDKLLGAVAHAHRHLVIHRDLKPSNVLVRADGEPKLLDFGVARLSDASYGADTASTRVASAGWASPEQTAGTSISTATDVYSLGVILRVLLGGGNDLHPAAPVPLADAELRGVVAMATAAAPDRRYRSVDALREELDRYRHGRPLRAAADTSVYRLRKFIGRHWLASATVSLAMLAAGAFTWRLVVERERALEAERNAEENLARSTVQQRFFARFMLGAGAKDDSGQPLTGSAMLDRAADALEAELSADPHAYAEIAAQLAQAYMNAGNAIAANRFAQQAVERTGDQESALVRATRLRLWARNLVAIGDDAQARAVAIRGIALIDDPPTDLEHAQLGAQLRITLANTPDDPQARARARSAAQQYAQRHLPEGDLLRGTATMIWAIQLEVEERYPELVAARRQALAQWLAAANAFPTDIAFQEMNLARALRLAGDPEAALAAIGAAEARFSKALGSRMINGRIDAIVERSAIELARGDWQAARQSLDRYLAQASAQGTLRSFDSLMIEAQLRMRDGHLNEARAVLAAARGQVRYGAQQRWLDELGAALDRAQAADSAR